MKLASLDKFIPVAIAQFLC